MSLAPSQDRAAKRETVAYRMVTAILSGGTF
jgi:hypothetical protein